MNRKTTAILLSSIFIGQQGDAGSLFTLGTVNARDAVPFIIAGVPALAIGGFSGNDPVFTMESFRTLVERGELRYFLMPGADAPGGPAQHPPQEHILRHVRLTWEDVSLAAGLPPGNLYRYQGSR